MVTPLLDILPGYVLSNGVAVTHDKGNSGPGYRGPRGTCWWMCDGTVTRGVVSFANETTPLSNFSSRLHRPPPQPNGTSLAYCVTYVQLAYRCHDQKCSSNVAN